MALPAPALAKVGGRLRKRPPGKPLRRGDSALVKAFAETEPPPADDAEEEEEEFVGGKVVARLRDALASLGTRVVDVFKQWCDT